MITIINILETIDNIEGLSRTLRNIEVCRTAAGRAIYFVGNSAVVVKVRIDGTLYSMKCYTNPSANLEIIYGNQLLKAELGVYDHNDNLQWIDVVLLPWIEGCTLRIALQNGCDVATLSAAFDCLAMDLLERDYAHGDIKCENIIVAEDGSMQLIDHDSCFLPQFKGELSPELGTTLFQHPERSVHLFDRHIDDYSIALVSSALRTIAADPTIIERYPLSDGLLFDPEAIMCGSCPAWNEALEMAAVRGDGRCFRMLTLLKRTFYRLDELKALLRPAIECEDPTTLQFELSNGYGRYVDSEGIEHIPPIFSDGCSFKDLCTAACIGTQWHIIDHTGTSLLHVGECETLRTPSGGVGYFRRDGHWLQYKWDF